MVLSICRICLPVFLGLALLVGAAVPAQADLLPHRVVYTLALGTSGTLTGGNGLMTFEIKDVCDGWAMDLKAELSLAGEDGQIHRLGWSQVSWESKDGKRYRYFTRELSDTEETSRRRGEARRDSPDGVAQVVADLFDGSIGNEAIEVGAALGPGALDWTPSAKAIADLKGVRSFPAALAFFMSGSPEGVPDTEQSMRLYSNGVVGNLTFALGDLKVHASMDELTPLKPEGC